jgi:CHAT domain-containing protein
VTARCLSAIGDTYAKTGDAEAALKYQFLAAAMFEKVDSTYLPGCYISLARAYNIAYQPLNAIHYLQRARYFGKRPGENAPLYAGLAFQLCDAYLQLNDHQQALAFIDSTLEILKNRKGLNRFNYRKAMLVKANILSKYMQSGEKDAVVKETDELIQTAQGIMASIISEITNTSDKLVIYSEAVKGMDLTITTYTQLFEATGDVKWLKKAFEFSEISKGLILYQHVLENKSRRQVAVPKPLADQEKSVHDLITDAEKRKYELGPKASSEENDNVQDQIFQLKKQYESIQNNIRAVCGDYFQEAGTFPAPQFDSLQRVLSPNEGLLEFFVGDSSISIFLMRRDTFVFRKIDHRVAVEKRIAQLRESICRYALSPRKNNDIYLAAASDYVESAYGLHHLLLAPFGKLLPARLTIVPDGRVAYLPFEALLVEKPDRPDRFHLHHYLFRDFTIRYASSATLLQEMGNLPPALPNSGRLLAMAPFFDGSTVWDDSLRAMQADFNRSVAAPLPYSGEEVFKVAKITRGFVCTGANASKNTFIQEAPKYRVLHLATHAQANMVTGDFSFLAFAPYHGYPNGERMYVSEIYGLKLNTELVTLSACETGLGQIYQGEGIVSIARAFAAAGAHSILESQWAVNDAQTRFLMELFYQNLKKRKSKDVALQNAQRAYLSMFQGENAHPYYWAGFILMGDNRPLSLF